MARSSGSAIATEASDMAHAAGLVYVTDDARGIRRVREGASFKYLSEGGRVVCDRAVLERIRRLAIPPAYEEVWICSNPRGHLQATGRDARGRKQYRYHAQWRVVRDSAKFERMAAFGATLGRLRRRLRRDLAQPGLTRERVLALVVSLLDSTRIRVGNDEYARANGSYGLTTLRSRHVRFGSNGRLRLCFRGKGGQEHTVEVDDVRLARFVRRCHELPGQRLFQYLDDAGLRRPVDSDQVNGYLRDATGADFTAKDFRTWGATLRAVELLLRRAPPDHDGERAAKSVVVEVTKQVAAELRNTPAVCRKSYINPVVFDAWRSARLHEAARVNGPGRGRKVERLTLVLVGAAQPAAGDTAASRNARRRSAPMAATISSRRASSGARSAAEG